MTNDEGSPNAPAFAELRRGRQMTKQLLKRTHPHSDLVIPSSLDISHSSLRSGFIATDATLAELVRKIAAADRVAVDTEADSLHSYREKLCLLQISVPAAIAVAGIGDAGCEQGDSRINRDHPPSRGYGGTSRSRLQVHDFIVDPLAGVDLEPLRPALEPREIVLHGADYDLRMLRRGLNFTAHRISIR